MAKHKNNRLTASWGARFLRLYDDFKVDAEGSILGGTTWDTSFTNNIVGPQVGMQWVNQRQRWRLQTDAKFMFGYNIADWDQVGLMGEGLVPGGLNQPLYGRPTAFSHGLREQDFAPVIDAIQGDGFNPLWLQVLISFNAGFTPHQFVSEEEIEAAAAGANPEITLIVTDEVYRCSVVGSK
jgi:hypothetical protein